MNVCASGVHMVCKKNTGNLYWFGPRNTLRPVRKESSVLSCTEVLVVGVTSECERGRGSQVLTCEWNAYVTLPEPSQGPEESCAYVLSREAFLLSVFDSPPRTVHACLFYSLKEMQGYEMLVCRRSLLEKQPWGLGGSLSGGDMSCTVEAWRRYFWHYGYMARHACHY
jgi:hypothetical protein